MVVNQLPRTEQNAMLHLFSAQLELVRYGQAHYRQQSRETSTLLHRLLRLYREDTIMSDKLQEFVRNEIKQILAELSPEERLKGLTPEERLGGLTLDEVLNALSPESREALILKIKGNGVTPKTE